MISFTCNNPGNNISKIKGKQMKRLTLIPLELLFWVFALVGLGFAEPEIHGQVQHFTLCPLANMGIDWCPGCGLGRSITQFLNGNIEASLAHHWLGIPALFIILLRVWTLFKMEFRRFKNYKLI